MKFSYKQKEIFDQIIHFFVSSHDSQVFVFSGCAGSGKTTMIREIVKFLSYNFSMSGIVLAYTGKAANVLMNRGITAQTIHSYLYVPVLDESGNLIRFEINLNPRFGDYIIVDEGSMIPENILIDLTKLGLRILVVGDENQLPPVGSDFNIMEAAHVRLEEVHRQFIDNPIIRLSQYLLEHDRFPSSSFIDGNYVKYLNRRDYKKHIIDAVPYADIFLCGTNAKRVEINNLVRKQKGFANSFIPYPTEKIICLRNDYSGLLPLINGDVFVVNNVEERNDVYVKSLGKAVKVHSYLLNDNMTVLIEDDVWNNGKYHFHDSLKHFDFAYAITVWKSQGSEYNDVMFFDEDVSYFVDRTRFRYTAVTRSKKFLKIIK